MNGLAILFLMFVAPALATGLALLGLSTFHSNPLGWFLLLTSIIYAAGIVIVVHIRRERFWESQLSGETTQEEHGDRSLWLITLGMVAMFYLSPLEYLYIKALLPRTVWMETIGMVLAVLGSVLFVWSRCALGLNYSGHIQIKQRQELIEIGPYRIIRHPAYAGNLLMAIGIVIGYSSLAGLAAVVILLFPCACYRMKVEESILFEHFGEPYQLYASRAKRLILGIW